ncbi:hypothetical protein QQP08_011416 [Theobroma cacao]|nr:hypothetical protein QQP08_011416 [Theobroma cacao]
MIQTKYYILLAKTGRPPDFFMSSSITSFEAVGSSGVGKPFTASVYINQQLFGSDRGRRRCKCLSPTTFFAASSDLLVTITAPPFSFGSSSLKQAFRAL